MKNILLPLLSLKIRHVTGLIFSCLSLSATGAETLLSFNASHPPYAPINQGWTPTKGGNPTLSEGAGVIGGQNVWQIVSGSGSDSNFSYRATLTNLEDQQASNQGWSLKTSLAVSSLSSYNTAATSILFYSNYKHDGTLMTTGTSWLYALRLGADSEGRLQVGLANYLDGSLLYTAPHSGLSSLELRFSSTSKSASFYANNTLILQDYIGYQSSSYSAPGVYWGKINAASNTRTSSWNSVELSAIPEPSMLGLTGVLMIGGICMRILGRRARCL